MELSNKAAKSASRIGKAIVTGGAGFIGSNIANFLASCGVETVALDNLSFGVRSNLSKDVSFVKKDLNELEASDLAGVDVVFNQAAVSSVTRCMAEPQETVNTNVGAFSNLVKCARENGTRIVYASTSSVYNGVAPPHREDARLSFKTIYEITKFADESVARYFNNSVGLRYFSVYGPNERHKAGTANLVTQFLWDAKAGRGPVIYGDGSQKRDFVHVDDVVEANVLAATSDLSKFPERVFNVGTGVAVDLKELVGMVNEIAGTDIAAKHIENPLGANYVDCVQADTSLASKRLGFDYSIGLEQGIRRISQVY